MKTRMVTGVDHLEIALERYTRLVREADALVRSAEMDERGRALVSLGALNRLSREVKGQPQPSATWMKSHLSDS